MNSTLGSVVPFAMFQIDSCICFMFYNKDKDKVTIRGLSDTATWYSVLARQKIWKGYQHYFTCLDSVCLCRGLRFCSPEKKHMYVSFFDMRTEQIHSSVLFLFIQGGKTLSDWSLLGHSRRRAPRWELLLYWGMIQTGGCKGIWIIGPGSGTRLWGEKCDSGVDKGGQSGEFVSRRVTNLHTSTRSNSNFRLRWNINWWSSSCPLKSSLFQLLSPWCWWKWRVAWVSNWAHLFVRHLFVGTVASAPPDKSIDIQPWLSRTPNNG